VDIKAATFVSSSMTTDYFILLIKKVNILQLCCGKIAWDNYALLQMISADMPETSRHLGFEYWYPLGTSAINHDAMLWNARMILTTLKTGAFHSTKNSGKNFRKFPWANGTDFSSVENDKPHSFVRLEFFNDLEV